MFNLRDSLGDMSAKKFLERYLNINTNENIFEAISYTTGARSVGVRYRRINSEWNENEEQRLTNFAIGFGNQEELIAYVRENPELLQEEYGRTSSAILSKMERLGLIQFSDGFGWNEIERDIERYAFPREHIIQYGSVGSLFHTIADILDRNLPSAFVPCIGYESAVHEQFTHVTLPIKYKGADIGNYTQSEQIVLDTIAGYIEDRSRFALRNGTRDVLVPAYALESDEPRILCVKLRKESGNEQYVDMFFRRRFNPYNNHPQRVTDTEIIQTLYHNIYHFKHPSPLSFENIRVKYVVGN